MNNYSDEQLVKLAIDDNKEALEVLVARYLKLVYNFAYRYVRNSDDAEDITQDVFVKIWRNLHKFDQTKKFKPWLYQIIKNTALDLLKKKSAIPFSNFDREEGDNWLEEHLVDEFQQTDIKAENTLLSDKLSGAIGKLTPKYAEVVSLHHQKDLNFREIAELNNESINTVKSRYRRALSLLKKILGI
jgi:RNA polymerase sigma-70 factor (ECF subfamily)